MRILLDTHVLIAVLESRLDVLQLGVRAAVTHPEAIAHASVASLWGLPSKHGCES
jgi:PIN domain nuclease of toxin-antitoxin system